jgi:hypothetical protein
MFRLCRRKLFHLDFLCDRFQLTLMMRFDGSDTFVTDRELFDAELRVADQHAYVSRMIMHGAATQAAEDRLQERERKPAQLRAVQRRSKIGR